VLSDLLFGQDDPVLKAASHVGLSLPSGTAVVFIFSVAFQLLRMKRSEELMAISSAGQ